MPKRIPAEAFAREIDAWANYGLTVREIAEITGIKEALLYRRSIAKFCTIENMKKLEDSRIKLEEAAEEAILDGRDAIKTYKHIEIVESNYEESNAPESCGDPSPLSFAKGCKCKDCHYTARAYKARRTNA